MKHIWTNSLGEEFASKHLAFAWLNKYNGVDVVSLFCIGEKRYTKIGQGIYDHYNGNTVEKLNEI